MLLRPVKMSGARGIVGCRGTAAKNMCEYMGCSHRQHNLSVLEVAWLTLEPQAAHSYRSPDIRVARGKLVTTLPDTLLDDPESWPVLAGAS